MAVTPGSTPVMTRVHGDGDPGRLDIVIVGDGFTAADNDPNAAFDMAVADFYRTLKSTSPFKERMVRSNDKINIYSVKVNSNERGTDGFENCCDMNSPTGERKDTALETGRCCGGQSEPLQCVASSCPDKIIELASWAPDFVRGRDLVIVLVNEMVNPEGGGDSNRRIAYSTLRRMADSKKVGVRDLLFHEMGHALGNLADEYEGRGCPAYNVLKEPDRVNITIETDRTKLKWGMFVTPTTNIPTCSNPCASRLGAEPHPTPCTGYMRGVVGTFEGANKYSRRIYRPQRDCRMGEQGSSKFFCKVCENKIGQDIDAIVNSPAPTATSSAALGAMLVPTPYGESIAVKAVDRSVELYLDLRFDQESRNAIFKLQNSAIIGDASWPINVNEYREDLEGGAAELIGYKTLDKRGNQLSPQGMFILWHRFRVEYVDRSSGHIERKDVPIEWPSVRVNVPFTPTIHTVEFDALDWTSDQFPYPSVGSRGSIEVKLTAP